MGQDDFGTDRRGRYEPPPCRGCKRTMRLVGRESAPALRGAETFTFECECGQVDVVTTTTRKH